MILAPLGHLDRSVDQLGIIDRNFFCPSHLVNDHTEHSLWYPVHPIFFYGVQPTLALARISHWNCDQSPSKVLDVQGFKKCFSRGTGRKVSKFIVFLEKVSQVQSVCHPRTKATKNRQVGRCVQLRDVLGITDIGS